MSSIFLIIIITILVFTFLIECIHELLILIYDSTLDREEPVRLEAGDNQDIDIDMEI